MLQSCLWPHLAKLCSDVERTPRRQVQHNLLAASRHCDGLDVSPDPLHALSPACSSGEADPAHDLDGLTHYVLQHDAAVGFDLCSSSCQEELAFRRGEMSQLINQTLEESNTGSVSSRLMSAIVDMERLTSIHDCSASVSLLMLANLYRMTATQTLISIYKRRSRSVSLTVVYELLSERFPTHGVLDRVLQAHACTSSRLHCDEEPLRRKSLVSPRCHRFMIRRNAPRG